MDVDCRDGFYFQKLPTQDATTRDEDDEHAAESESTTSTKKECQMIVFGPIVRIVRENNFQDSFTGVPNKMKCDTHPNALKKIVILAKKTALREQSRTDADPDRVKDETGDANQISG